MRELRSPSEIRLERLVRGLSVFTFVLMCWTLNRVMIPRENCVRSDYVGIVKIQGQEIDNCAFESRLRLGGPRLNKINLARLRKLEDTSALVDWFKPLPALKIDVVETEPRAFGIAYNENTHRFVLRLGTAWIDEGDQVRRALAMAILEQAGFWKSSQYQLETLADFVLLSQAADTRWTDARGEEHDWTRDVSMATASTTFSGYCKSPYRSLAHDRVCKAGLMPDDGGAPWHLRPLLSMALAREYRKLSLKQKMRVIAAVRRGIVLPTPKSPAGKSVEAMVLWFHKAVRDHAGALQMLTGTDADVALSETLRELQVASPTRWDVTFDLRHAPQWREILGQLEGRAKFRPKERALVFTPEGEIALPSGLPVEWATRELDSRKHVMIACKMPTAGEGLSISARQFFARQTCGKLGTSFWD